MEAPFAAIVEECSNVLQGLADEQPPVTVTTELDQPTADTCPHVMVILGNASYDVSQIAQLSTQAGIDRMRLTISIVCTAVSANAADAARQRDNLVQRVVNRIRQYPQLNGLVQYLIRTGIDFPPREATQAGIFAGGVITLEAGLLT